MNTIAAPFSHFSRLKLLLLLVALPALASAAEMPAWLVLNPSDSPETLMSTDVLEKNGLVRGGWRVSGTGLLHTEGGADTGLLHRMVHPLPKGAALRMLVATADDVNAQLKAGYVIEGALGYVALKPGPGHIAVYRFTKENKFIWLISGADQAWATKNGWTREQAVFWLWVDNNR
jgi:hypothetical protein